MLTQWTPFAAAVICRRDNYADGGRTMTRDQR